MHAANDNSITFREAAEDYIREGKDGRYLGPIIEHLGDRRLPSIFPKQIEKMAIQLYPTQSNATRNRCAITPARAVINHGYDNGWCNLIRIKRLKEDAPERKTPASPVWMHSFLRRCAKDELPHIAAIVLFMSQTAARVSEATRLTWKDVDLNGRKALLVRTKTGRNSVRHLTDELVYRLRELRGDARDEDPVFRIVNRHNVNDRIKAVCRRAEISYKSSHMCGRHTFATNAIELGMDIKTAMDAGDWKSPAIFLNTYVHLRQNASRMVADRFNAMQYDIAV